LIIETPPASACVIDIDEACLAELVSFLLLFESSGLFVGVEEGAEEPLLSVDAGAAVCDADPEAAVDAGAADDEGAGLLPFCRAARRPDSSRMKRLAGHGHAADSEM